MRLAKILLVPLILFAFTISGCDNDSSTNAQEPMPMPAPAGCPCFDMNDVMALSVNTEGITCENEAWRLNLISDSPEGGQLISGCSGMGTDCSCLGPGSGGNSMDIELDEAGECFHMLLNGLIEFGPDLVVSGGCFYLPPGN